LIINTKILNNAIKTKLSFHKLSFTVKSNIYGILQRYIFFTYYLSDKEPKTKDKSEKRSKEKGPKQHKTIMQTTI